MNMLSVGGRIPSTAFSFHRNMLTLFPQIDKPRQRKSAGGPRSVLGCVERKGLPG